MLASSPAASEDESALWIGLAGAGLVVIEVEVGGGLPIVPPKDPMRRRENASRARKDGLRWTPTPV